MIQKTEAILLRKQDLRETSLFLSFYTKSSGKIYGVMKGIRGQKGQYSTAPQLFSLNEIVFYERKNKDVFTISQCELRKFFAEIRESLEKTSHAMYFVELVNFIAPIGEKNERLYDLLEKSLGFLCGQASAKRIARIFEIKLLDILGLMPHLQNCIVCGSFADNKIRFSLKNGGVICGECAIKEKEGVPISSGTINFIEHINRSSWDMVLRIKVSQDVGHQLENLLRSFIAFHLQLKPKTLEFMKKVLI
ncbi:MAG: DNA repair protein RecO [Candidatus Omnitrophica bacterium]|nr:DNA repair protein RecO [Candidatus Omnitrophota bacterium]